VPTAIITGASLGLGLAIAHELAAKKYDLLLVARGREGLETAAAALRARGVAVQICAADLTSAEGLDTVAARIAATPDVAVLVNNAGFGNYGRTWELDPQGSEGEIDLNIRALVRLTRAALPAMVRAKRGTIVNIASTAGMQPVPYFAVYGATKAFVVSYSEAVNAELTGSGLPGVKVMALCPGPMETGFQARSGSTKSTYGFLPWETVEGVAARAAAEVGKGSGVVVTSWLNAALVFFNRFTPRKMLSAVTEKVFRPKTAAQSKAAV
jgi:short-subunit dehydrogenase